jgi:predicted histidine transporter YuiF (NhaC family)
MVWKILSALLSHYIKQRAKQTLKKQDNSSQTMSSQNHLTTEPLPTTIATSSADTTEKITMAEATTEEVVGYVYHWAIERIETLTKTKTTDDQFKNAMAIAGEFEEWIDSETLGMEDIEIMSIERY